jgi:phosphoglycerate dehydrogenase-like enzyme
MMHHGVSAQAMTGKKLNVLVGTDIVDQKNLDKLSKFADVNQLSKLAPDRLAEVLSNVDALLVFSWPKELTAENIARLSKLKFIQSILAGVNHIPFVSLKNVIVSSNAGAYSEEVAEYAWALLLTAAKRTVDLHMSVKDGNWSLKRTLDPAREVTILHSGTLGILGFGGIGRAVAKIAKGFAMQVVAYSRSSGSIPGVRLYKGTAGLSEVLRKSDGVVLALPLTNQTTHIINASTLAEMKKSAILVNIARGELVEEKSVFDHMQANSNFRYATDVWWYREGRESLKTTYPFFSLTNFVGTPHVSGPSGLATGKPVELAIENTIRFLRGLKPKNVVDPSEYLAQGPQPY